MENNQLSATLRRLAGHLALETREQQRQFNRLTRSLTNANGNELLTGFVNAGFQIDRPVQVDGRPPAVRSRHSLLLIAVNTSNKLIYLFDDNLLQDEAQFSGTGRVDPGTGAPAGGVNAWLVCRVKWMPSNTDEVEVSFHFAPLSDQFAGSSTPSSRRKSRRKRTASPASRTPSR